MISSVTVVGYLVLWLALRVAALRFSKPARVRRGSPWFTRLVLAYCFLLCLGFIAANLGAGEDSGQANAVRLAMAILMVALALVVDTLCLLSLGPLYSLEMAVKESHPVVKCGLYRLVRHPIYLSNIIGFLGLCLLINHWAAWLALPAQAAGFLLMAREEESFLISHLGEEYERYRADVRWMLVPGFF